MSNVATKAVGSKGTVTNISARGPSAPCAVDELMAIEDELEVVKRAIDHVGKDVNATEMTTPLYIALGRIVDRLTDTRRGLEASPPASKVVAPIVTASQGHEVALDTISEEVERAGVLVQDMYSVAVLGIENYATAFGHQLANSTDEDESDAARDSRKLQVLLLDLVLTLHSAGKQAKWLRAEIAPCVDADADAEAAE